MSNLEIITGKVEQARAIKMAMSYAMPSELFYQMNEHHSILLREAIQLNEPLNPHFNRVQEMVNEVVDIEIIEKY